MCRWRKSQVQVRRTSPRISRSTKCRRWRRRPLRDSAVQVAAPICMGRPHTIPPSLKHSLVFNCLNTSMHGCTCTLFLTLNVFICDWKTPSVGRSVPGACLVSINVLIYLPTVILVVSCTKLYTNSLSLSYTHTFYWCTSLFVHLTSYSPHMRTHNHLPK